jgi:diguanylate cyclase (GGDEF)-like protein/PAS domain S-box-containing protein
MDQVIVEDFLQHLYATLDDRDQELNRLYQLLDAESLHRRQIESELHQERELAYSALQAIADGVITTDMSGRLHYFNPIAQTILQQNLQDVQGLPLARILSLYDNQHACFNLDISQVLQTQEPLELRNQLTLLRSDGSECAIDVAVLPMRDRVGQTIGAIVVLRDMTATRQLVQQLSWQSRHDPLTGLMNRREFESHVQQAIEEAQVGQQQHILCYVDLDQFKVINESCGHQIGDQLLCELGGLLSQEIRSIDVLARLGGDEFGVLLRHCASHQAHQVISRIQAKIQAYRLNWRGQSFAISASFGLVPLDRDSQDLRDVLSTADAACYAAKEAGRNRIHFYQPDDDELSRQRRERILIAQIHQAIEADRFLLYAQAIVPIEAQTSNGLKHHVEILLRMIDDQGQLVSPGYFIPAAERYGLMPTLDRVVIEKFCQSYAAACLSLSGKPLDRCLYAINLSARSLNDHDLIHFIKTQFATHRVPTEIICFEITETAAIFNIDTAAEFMTELKQMGFRFALDDFGVGMNSFAYLKHLAIDYLKIDGSFVKNILTETIDRALVSCMNQIAHELGAKTVAEWVENDEILTTLQQLGVDYAQGYGISKPQPLNFILVENY